MPKVSVNILTKDRPELLKKAAASVLAQSFTDYEVVIVDDHSSLGNLEKARELLKELAQANLQIISSTSKPGITSSRQLELSHSQGKYIAILDDDDAWQDQDKLKKQVEYLDNHPDVVLVGGGIKSKTEKFRPETDQEIRNTMLFQNNFFTSTVMFRKQAAIDAGGFKNDRDDFAEDYDLWLRMGMVKNAQMHNFQEVFTAYTSSSYNRKKFGRFLTKQLRLIKVHKADYPYYRLAAIIIRIRLLF